MEKEDKIKLQEAQSFYGRIKSGFPYFALTVMTILKITLRLGFGVQ